VTVEGFPGELKHTYGDDSLCMWFPADPPERRWTVAKGLLALIEMALVHLFRERYVIATGERWPGEEAPHGPDERKRDEEAIGSEPSPSVTPPRAPGRLRNAA
jgi:hypothetical protein